MLVSEISCVVDHAKLPNRVIAAVVGFIYFWKKKKMKGKPFGHWKEDAVMKFNLNEQLSTGLEI